MQVQTEEIAATLFRETMSSIPSAVTIVTTTGVDGRPTGMCAISFCSVSLDPPLILVCIDKNARTLPALQANGRFAVNFLGHENEDLADNFASKADDKFSGVDWTPAPKTGQPILNDALGHFECTIWQTVDAGDHYIVLGLVRGGSSPTTASTLIYWNRTYIGIDAEQRT